MIYFKHSEFDSPDYPGSGTLMLSDLLFRLEKAREIAGVPFKINSGYRTIQHNKAVRGSENSSHLKGVAVDIHCTSGSNREKIINGLVHAGFKRIGIAKTFIHADTDSDKVSSIWLY